LAVVLFFVVFLSNLAYLIRRWSNKEEETNSEILIQFRVNREIIQLTGMEINYFESLGDYVKIYSSESTFITKEKISKLEQRLPSLFIRIHRSSIINILKIESFNMKRMMILGREIPISRKYKDEVSEKLKKSI
jgi:DNA-binding LytR/AlgR family response regulator